MSVMGRKSATKIADLRNEARIAVEQRNRAAAAATKWRQRAQEADIALRKAENEISSTRERANVATRLAESSQRTADRMVEVVAELHKQLSRQPEVVVESILTGIAPLFIGYRDDTTDNSRLQAALTGMGALGLDADSTESRGYYPDIEFDESMESRDRWPMTATEMSAQTLPGSRATTIDGDHAMANGQAVRTDGQTMFTSGSGLTSPPGNATE